MAGRRNLPPCTVARTPAQQIESGHRLNDIQAQIYALWDRQILLLKLEGRTPREISESVGCSETHVRKRLPLVLEAEARKGLELSGLELFPNLSAWTACWPKPGSSGSIHPQAHHSQARRSHANLFLIARANINRQPFTLLYRHGSVRLIPIWHSKQSHYTPEKVSIKGRLAGEVPRCCFWLLTTSRPQRNFVVIIIAAPEPAKRHRFVLFLIGQRINEAF